MGKLMRGLLWCLSRLYGAGASVRHALYDRGLLKQEGLSVPVISVGNIACGGTGKTPLVKLLVAELSKTKRVAILTRGYRSEAEKRPGGVCIRPDRLPSPEVCGDEPYLLAKSLPGVPLYVGRDRITSAKRAIQEGAEVLVLDDGMQHRKLQRNLELVVLDGEDLFGKGDLLPAGRLRDRPNRLKGADGLFVNHIRTQEEYEAAKKQLEKYSTAPVIGMGYRIEKKEFEKVGLFCALGTPERFVRSVEERGYEIVARQFALDHRPFNLKQLERFAKRAFELGAKRVVCTEKDAVKLSKTEGLALPIEVIPGDLEIRFGQELLNQLLTRVNA